MDNIKSLKITYIPINGRNTFTNGDLISGEVTVKVSKETQIKSLFIKFRAKANVLWRERLVHSLMIYHAKEKYFSSKHYFIQDKNVGVDNQTLLRNPNGEIYSSVVAPGCHVYPFTFQIPSGKFPSSFRGRYGKIVYQLEARLSRSMRITKKDSADIYFVSRPDPNSFQQLMAPKHGTRTKKMKAFSLGSVSMDVNIEKTGFVQGEGMKVMAVVQNNSSREIKLKYRLYVIQNYFAMGGRKFLMKNILKEVGERIPPSTKETVMRVITIPSDMEPSILNCNIIKVEYRLKVYLDVKYAIDPEITFPIIILPACQAPSGPTHFESFGNPNPPVQGTKPPVPAVMDAKPPLAPSGPPVPAASQTFDAQPPHGAHAMCSSVKDSNTTLF